jgi:hypothetical protein
MSLAVQASDFAPLQALRRLAASAFDLIVVLSNANGLLKEVEVLNATSDEELAAAGTDRGREVSRIFSSRYY